MNYRRYVGAASAALLIVIAILMLAPGVWAASKYKTLYKFRGHKDGGAPYAGLVFDTAGNLYGTTIEGGNPGGQCGASGCGVVFKLTPNPNGNDRWKEMALYRFGIGNRDGHIPLAGLIFDTAGNLYGTTSRGGSHRASHGTVFKLTPNPDGSWTESVLYRFTDGKDGDGAVPVASLIFDTAGNLYGTTSGGGTHQQGTVFKLAPNPDGSWTESVLYRFTGGKDGDGSVPVASLIFDTAGNLYGTTSGGGTNQQGTVFQLMPNLDGSWTENVLYRFTGGKDGGYPYAGLIFDQAGNLYGTTLGGGRNGRGVVFKLTPNPDGSWTESTLHGFPGYGGSPYAGLIFDQAGNLYGTAFYSNYAYDDGMVFKLTPNPDGSWEYSILREFRSHSGANPHAGLTFDQAGNLYGTTPNGSPYGYGVVFKLTPNADGPLPTSASH
jgi:uncharacterized repeat protein (TIGR03803 family)